MRWRRGPRRSRQALLLRLLSAPDNHGPVAAAHAERRSRHTPRLAFDHFAYAVKNCHCRSENPVNPPVQKLLGDDRRLVDHRPLLLVRDLHGKFVM